MYRASVLAHAITTSAQCEHLWDRVQPVLAVLNKYAIHHRTIYDECRAQGPVGDLAQALARSRLDRIIKFMGATCCAGVQDAAGNVLTDDTFVCFKLVLGPSAASHWSTWLTLKGAEEAPIATLSIIFGWIAVVYAFPSERRVQTV